MLADAVDQVLNDPDAFEELKPFLALDLNVPQDRLPDDVGVVFDYIVNMETFRSSGIYVPQQLVKA